MKFVWLRRIKVLRAVLIVVMIVTAVLILVKPRLIPSPTSQLRGVAATMTPRTTPTSPSLSSWVSESQQIASVKDLVLGNKLPTSRWIVVDGLTSSECTDVTSFTQHRDWRVVLVLSRRIHFINGCSFPRCVILTEDNRQVMLGQFSLTRMLNKPSKLFGYLYAIHQGAYTILDATCDDNISINLLPQFARSNSNSNQLYNALLYNQSSLFNPSEHYGHASPSSQTLASLEDHLDISTESSSKDPQTKSHLNSQMYFLVRSGLGSVFQSVSECYSECGGRRRHGAVPLNDKRPSSPPTTPVTLGVETLGVFDTGPTLFHRDAFLWMFVPVDVPRHAQNIFRTFFIHSIRSLTKQPIAYYPLDDSFTCSCSRKMDENLQLDGVRLKEFVHLVNETSRQDINLSVQSHFTIAFLLKVISHIEGMNPIFSPQGIDMSMRALLIAWMDDLATMQIDDFDFPNKLRHSPSNVQQDSGGVKIKYAFPHNPWNFASPSQLNQIRKNVFDRMNTLCSGGSKASPDIPLKPESWANPVSNDIMLVVIMNYEFLFNSSFYLEYVHRHFFKYIVYCGPGVDHFEEFARKNGFTYISYMEGLLDGWETMYECVSNAMKLGLPVKGYLHIGEDTLVNTRKILSLPRDQIWMPTGYDEKNIYETKTMKGWSHWQQPHGRAAVIEALQELHNASKADTAHVVWKGKNRPVSQQYKSFAKRFLQTYDKNIGLKNVVHRAIDFYYIPETLRSDFLLASEVFRRHGAIIEMAIPVIHLGLSPKSKIQYVHGASLWRKDRETPWKFFDVNNNHFLHPFKPLLHLNNAKGRQFICKTVLPQLFNFSSGRLR